MILSNKSISQFEVLSGVFATATAARGLQRRARSSDVVVLLSRAGSYAACIARLFLLPPPFNEETQSIGCPYPTAAVALAGFLHMASREVAVVAPGGLAMAGEEEGEGSGPCSARGYLWRSSRS